MYKIGDKIKLLSDDFIGAERGTEGEIESILGEESVFSYRVKFGKTLLYVHNTDIGKVEWSNISIRGI